MTADHSTRRQFLTKAAALTAAVAFTSAADAAAKAKSPTPNADKLKWRLSCQLYTFRDRSFYEALPVISSVGIRCVEPAFFLPLDKDRPGLTPSESLTPELRRELKARLADHGLTMPSYYAPIDANKDNFRKIFDFSKEMNVETIVAEPPAEVFDDIEKLCEEYKINLAIHNHPKGPNSTYWKPENVLEVCKGRSKRIGSCSDTGHWLRSGLDPIECLKKAQKRIIAMHLKDVIEIGNPEARDVPLGTGKANYTAVLNHLYTRKFRGLMTIEYEHLSEKLVDEVAQCVKFVENFAASAKA